MTYRMSCLAVLAAAALTLVGCSDDSPSSPSTTNSPRFTAGLLPSNEVPPVNNADMTGSGTVTVTLNLTRDSANNITSARADFQVTLQGFPANTVLTGAHIHPGNAGVNGGVIVNTGLTNGEVTLGNGQGGFSKTGITVTPEIAQAIINNPAGYYFNVHSTLNTPGAARGQLIRSN